MIKGKRNQLANVGNRFQTQVKKVVVVCSAGLLRSPTAANVLHTKFGFNTRAVGADKEFALIPLTQALIWWADLRIYSLPEEQIRSRLGSYEDKIINLWEIFCD